MHPQLLVILDGWGLGPITPTNAIHQAITPVWDHLWATYPHTALDASEQAVGLPLGQMGNSEVGHMMLGGGRVFFQELDRIGQTIAKPEGFGSLPALRQAAQDLAAAGRSCHVMGLASPGGVHAHTDHILAMTHCLTTAGVPVWLHLFLDGRDTPPQSALGYVQNLMSHLPPNARIATIGGRYWGMDRDQRWDRIATAYAAIVGGTTSEAPQFMDPLACIEAAYAADDSDEFLVPHTSATYPGIHPGDGLVCCNFRADRVRQLLTALVAPQQLSSPLNTPIKAPAFGPTIAMTSYSDLLDTAMTVLFPPQKPSDTLGAVISHTGLTQLRAAETEKYAHVTFFFNGGLEAPFAGEDRILIPSPQVATYDLQPEMSAMELTHAVIAAMSTGASLENATTAPYGLVVVNYANTDMVGHTGNLAATLKAVETVDRCLGDLLATAQHLGYGVCITADHGNAEKMEDPETHQPHTAHTCNLVPCVIIPPLSQGSETFSLRPHGTLADVAPTILQLMGLPQPSAMTGSSLLIPS